METQLRMGYEGATYNPKQILRVFLIAEEASRLALFVKAR